MTLPGPFEHDYTQAAANWGVPILFVPEGQGPIAFGFSWPDGSPSDTLTATISASIDGITYDDGNTLVIGGTIPISGGPPVFYSVLIPSTPLYPHYKAIISSAGAVSITQATINVWQPF